MPHDTFYTSAPWRKARAKHLALQPHCTVCLMLGLRVKASEVDHVLAMAAGGHPFADNNLRSLCRMHHQQKTIKIDGQHAGRGSRLVTTGLDGWPVHIENERKPRK